MREYWMILLMMFQIFYSLLSKDQTDQNIYRIYRGKNSLVALSSPDPVAGREVWNRCRWGDNGEEKLLQPLSIKFHNTPSISLSGSFQSCTWGTLPGRPLSPDSAGRPPPSSLLLSWAPSTVFLLDLLFVYFQLSLIDVEVENPGFAQNPKPGPVPGGRCSFFVQIPGPGPGGLELSPSRWPSCTRSRALRWWATPSRGSRRCGRAFSVLRRVLIVWRTPQERPGHQIYKQHRTLKAEQIKIWKWQRHLKGRRKVQMWELALGWTWGGSREGRNETCSLGATCLKESLTWNCTLHCTSVLFALLHNSVRWTCPKESPTSDHCVQLSSLESRPVSADYRQFRQERL